MRKKHNESRNRQKGAEPAQEEISEMPVEEEPFPSEAVLSYTVSVVSLLAKRRIDRGEVIQIWRERSLAVAGWGMYGFVSREAAPP